uniref:Uncharacterized protein n=1 Tax=Populus trichocarpa TaxID=3694 RepID=A0A3N7FWW7_POPTR
MELPNLQVLLLEQLSRIVCFSLGCYDFLFPHLEKLEVFECPKLITKFATTPNGSIRAQSEVSEVAEDSSTGCSAPISTCRTWTRNNGWYVVKEMKEGGEGRWW